MIKLIKNFRKKDWLIVLVSAIIIVLEVWLDLKMPDYMSQITVLVQTEGSRMSDILKNGGYMLLCAFGSLVGAVIVGYLISILASRFSRNLRNKLFKKVESLSMNEIKEFSTNSLITRTTNDITNVEMFIGFGLQQLIKAPVTAIWAITKILNKSWEWSMVTGVAVIILLSIIGMLVLIVLPKFKLVQKLTDKLNEVTRENLLGIRVVRAFNAEDYQEKRFESANNSLTDLQLFNQKTMSIMAPVMYLIMYMLTLIIYFIGAYLIKDAGLVDKIGLFGDMVVFSSYAMQIIMSFLMLAFIFVMLPRSQVSAGRINEVLDTRVSIVDGDFDGVTSEVGTVEFKNVSFKYPDAEEYVLKNISFKANMGDTVAFIGSTGSGKSTLVNLIVRFYDVTDGEVLVDGVDVKEYDEAHLHNKIGYISQKAIMFTGTVSENVAYGDNGREKPTEEQIKKAIEVAQGTDFVEKMDKKYDAHIARGGNNVSGGQKQRLAIARAIARDPEIYIFDDSFSALDYQTEAKLRMALKTLNKTIVNVSQRASSIKNADKILVLDDGKLVGFGNHNELMKSCELYKEIYYSQYPFEKEADHE